MNCITPWANKKSAAEQAGKVTLESKLAIEETAREEYNNGVLARTIYEDPGLIDDYSLGLTDYVLAVGGGDLTGAQLRNAADQAEIHELAGALMELMTRGLGAVATAGNIALTLMPVGGDFVAAARVVKGVKAAIRLRRAVQEGLATETNLARVIGHLKSIDALASHPPNAAMVARIQDAIANGRTLTTAERNFMTHELKEAQLMSQGVEQDLAHEMAGQTHPTYANYDPDVIKQFPEYFNSNWRAYWGIP